MVIICGRKGPTCYSDALLHWLLYQLVVILGAQYKTHLHVLQYGPKPRSAECKIRYKPNKQRLVFWSKNLTTYKL
ncbi:hypothetical protein XELAEV_18024251mg [Xenopus laevis]|uniref:Uncharacterized protein n=1 Tax=Xenopus laevis TaxID=8355 RepID=A0A974CXN3_XENLA|nr:hypothetical protein XELAEV_18024251mg [Xenopus laevis]